MEAYANREQLSLPAAPRTERRRACFAAVATPVKAVKEVKKTVEKKVETKKAQAKGAVAAAAAIKSTPDLAEVLKKASATAFRGGLAGFCAGVVQVRVRAGAPPAQPAAPPQRTNPPARSRLTSRPPARPASRWAPSCGCAP